MDIERVFEKHVIQGIMALLLIAAIVAMELIGRPVSPEMWAVVGMACGFYFGASATANGRVADVRRLAKDVKGIIDSEQV